MHSDLYWIEIASPVRVAIMARPRAGDWLEDEIKHWRDEGVGTVLSLLEPAEVEELGLRDEPVLCRAAGIDFVSLPIPDRGVPADPGMATGMVRRLIENGRPVAIHCRAGIGRSSLMAALLLSVAGIPPTAAFEAISKARGLTVPDTDDQTLWVERHGATR